ncbi:MAG: hypothetical protein M3R25_13135 [Bacteroidota bacterium]|nr:hypothetical protein [Bacteroidota bacterium]
MSTTHKWGSFLHTADEFIIAYASCTGNTISAPLFLIGHAVELYLKSAYTKQTRDIDAAVNFGHRIYDLWNACKSIDDKFMPQYELRDNVFQCPFLEKDIVKLLSHEDCIHFLENQEFYIVSKYLPDLKYLGAPLKKIKGAYAIPFACHNPYWIKFFKELRSYLEYPGVNSHNWFELSIEIGVTISTEQYLKEFYT